MPVLQRVGKDDPKVMAMIKWLNRSIHPEKSKGLIEEVIQNVVRSKSPLDQKMGTVSTLESSEENYHAILDKYNSMRKELDFSKERGKQHEDRIMKLNGEVAELKSSIRTLSRKLKEQKKQQKALTLYCESEKPAPSFLWTINLDMSWAETDPPQPSDEREP